MAGKTRLILGALALLGLNLLIVRNERARGRRQQAEHLLDQLTQAIRSYELDHAVYPVDLRALALYASRPKCGFIPDPDSASSNLCPDGRIPNPIWRDEPPPLGGVHYRRLEDGFCLWVLDENGRPLR